MLKSKSFKLWCFGDFGAEGALLLTIRSCKFELLGGAKDWDTIELAILLPLPRGEVRRFCEKNDSRGSLAGGFWGAGLGLSSGSLDDTSSSTGSWLGSSTLAFNRFLYIRCIAMKNIGFVKVSAPPLLLRSHTFAHVCLSNFVCYITCCICVSVSESLLSLSNILKIFM